MPKFIVWPWFDEGEDWPDDPGPQEVIEADSEDEARAIWWQRNPRITAVTYVEVREDS